MKGINISCSSHSSTSFYTPISMDQATSSSSSSSSLFPVTLLGGSTGGGGGSRMIDRHNPIITDERRVSRSTPPSSTNSTPFFTPKSSPFSLQKKTPKKTKNTSAGNAKRLIGLTPKIKSKSKAKSNGGHDYDDDHEHTIQALKKDASQPSDLITIKGASKAAVDHHISPPESSRYLLGDPVQEIGSGFFDRALSDFDPFLKLEDPFEEAEPEILASARKEELVLEPELKTSNSAKSPLPPHPPPKSNSSTSDQQVVVLRVSLHCRGCEGKVRKHISRMQGVRSFTIDFAAKKVTVVGDVTPLEVLASISKVKNAQIWTPPLPSNSKSMDPFTHNKF